jgi:hypothetical protein
MVGTEVNTKTVGYRYNDEGELFSIFVGTDRETKAVKYDAAKDQLSMVMRPAKRKGEATYFYIKPVALFNVCRGEQDSKSVVGFRYNKANESFAAWVATDRDTGAIQWDPQADKVALNLRKSKPRAEQAAAQE